MSKFSVLGSLLAAVLPRPLKLLVYRHILKYEIGDEVSIGLSLFVGVERVSIEDHVRIGHFNLFIGTRHIEVRRSAHVGSFNIFRGGHAITLGAYSSVLRKNTFNSIVDAETANRRDPSLTLGDGAVVTAGHWLDFTDRIDIGPNAIIGGRNSSLWTHNRQRTRPLKIGTHAYLGSDVSMAPGASVPAFSIVALGAVLMTAFDQAESLIAGNPAAVVRVLSDRDLFLVVRRNRRDLPDSIRDSQLSDRLRQIAQDAELSISGGDSHSKVMSESV